MKITSLIINQIGSEEEIERYYNKTIAEFKKKTVNFVQIIVSVKTLRISKLWVKT